MGRLGQLGKWGKMGQYASGTKQTLLLECIAQILEEQ